MSWHRYYEEVEMNDEIDLYFDSVENMLFVRFMPKYWKETKKRFIDSITELIMEKGFVTVQDIYHLIGGSDYLTSIEKPSEIIAVSLDDWEDFKYLAKSGRSVLFNVRNQYKRDYTITYKE